MSPPLGQRVIVLGAGMAGLAAADSLLRAGMEVLLLEARTRAGGRIETLRQFADGMFVEAGAMSIPDTHAKTLAYVAELNLSVWTHFIGRHQQASLYYIDGNSIRITPGKVEEWPAAIPLTPAERALGIAGMQQKYLDSFMSRVGDPFSPSWPAEDLLPYDSMSAYDFLLSQGASPAAAELIGMGLYNLDGEGLKSFSALLMLATEVTIYRSARSFLPAGGMDQLPRMLALKLSQNIRYNAEVLGLKQDASGVTVAFRSRDIVEAATGAYLICAIPFPVLRGLSVSPAFSAAKRKVIEEQPLTSVTRVFVQVREQFLKPLHLSGAAFTDLPIGNTYPAFQQTGQRAVLV